MTADRAHPTDSTSADHRPIVADALPLRHSSERALAADQEAALRYSLRAGAADCAAMLGLVAS